MIRNRRNDWNVAASSSPSSSPDAWYRRSFIDRVAIARRMRRLDSVSVRALLAHEDDALIERDALNRPLKVGQASLQRSELGIVDGSAIAALAVQVHVVHQLLEEGDRALAAAPVLFPVAGVQVLDHVVATRPDMREQRLERGDLIRPAMTG